MSRPVAVRAGIDCDAGVRRRRKVPACRTVEFDEHLRKLFERQSLDKRFRASLPYQCRMPLDFEAYSKTVRLAPADQTAWILPFIRPRTRTKANQAKRSGPQMRASRRVTALNSSLRGCWFLPDVGPESGIDARVRNEEVAWHLRAERAADLNAS